MNYRHGYHAGNFADVIKHVFLVTLLEALKKKEAPFCYIDTHAGAGCYDLFAAAASKTKEFHGGIQQLIQHARPPLPIKHYIQSIHQINNELSGAHYSSLRFYPGSPLIARHLLRAHDRIVACELQPDEYQALRNTFNGDKQVAVHHTDGFLGLKAFLPPAERRGIVLIDPPYEDPDEFTRIAHSLPSALKRWDKGMFAIWYPLKEKAQTERFYRTLKTTITQPIFAIELTIYPDLPHHLNGSGLAIINPPWQFDTTTNEILPWLWNALTINKQGGYAAQWLK